MIHSTRMIQNILISSLHLLDFNVYGYDITGISPVSIHFLLLFNVCLSLVNFQSFLFPPDSGQCFLNVLEQSYEAFWQNIMSTLKSCGWRPEFVKGSKAIICKCSFVNICNLLHVQKMHIFRYLIGYNSKYRIAAIVMKFRVVGSFAFLNLVTSVWFNKTS